jgi:hypothetical protein
MKNITLTIEAGSKTEQLWKEIHNSLSDDLLDSVGVERTHAPGEGSANEPVTIAVTLAIPTIAITVGIVRIIEKWLENKRQEGQLTLLIEGASSAPEAVEDLRRLAEKHSEVSLKIKPATARDFRQ